jgi:hypothetical protein
MVRVTQSFVFDVVFCRRRYQRGNPKTDNTIKQTTQCKEQTDNTMTKRTNRQHNEKNKRTNNDLQDTTQKTKDCVILALGITETATNYRKEDRI